MTKAAKTRVLLLLLATFATLLALAPPKPARACITYEVDVCVQSNGAHCSQSDCARLNTCDGTQSQSSCVFQSFQCCR
ncbi:MAG: hypothetical protein WAM82_11315 [Thermoanaerobaculia bacterium]